MRPALVGQVAAAAAASFLVALGMAASLTLTPWALAALVAALGAAAVAASPAAAAGGLDEGEQVGRSGVAYGALALLAVLDVVGAPADEPTPGYRLAIGAGSLLAVAMLVVHRRGDERARARALWVVVGAKLLLLTAAPLCVPRPPIDVWQLNQYAVDYLLHGRNPYGTMIPDIHQGRSPYGYQPYYPYPPLNLLLSVPARALCGDYRYGLVAALAGTVALLRAAGARLRVPPRLVDLATLALVLDPRLERLVVHGWTEPYLMAALATVVYLEARTPGSPAALGALLALPLLKQYVAAPVLLYLWLLRPPRRTLLVVGGAGLAALLLGALGAGAALRAALDRGVLYFLQRTQFRPDSVSLVAALHPLTGYLPTPLTAAVAQLGCGLAAGYGVRAAAPARRLGAWLLASGVALLGSFLAAPQAFVNYYAFVSVVLLLAAMALGRGAPDGG